MQEVQIGKFAAHYHLPPAALTQWRRLDQVMKTVLDEALERALASAGLPENGELCLRQIRVPVRLRLASADAALAAEWGQALAAEIARALRDGRALFYHSRRQAWLDVAVSLARGDLQRIWAWRQLGLWRARAAVSAGEAVFELVSAVAAEPAAVMPLLVALAEAGWLESLAQRLTARQWVTLARAALHEAGALELLAETADELLPETADTPSSRVAHDAWRVLNCSRLLPALTAALAGASRETCSAVAALVVLEAEPARLRSDAAHALIGVIANALRAARPEAKPALSEPVAIDEKAPDANASPTVPRREVETKVADLRQRAWTRFGGLLFLLGLIEELELVDEILAHPTLGARSFRWTMHRLALSLVPAEEADPAALAFAGLPPDAALPLEREPPGEIESAALQMLAARIVTHLGALLEWRDELAALLAFVCQRRAEIVAEPGWIDVKLALDDVATEVRRAGLDLNPGFVPWLGVVVRFVYE